MHSFGCNYYLELKKMTKQKQTSLPFPFFSRSDASVLIFKLQNWNYIYNETEDTKYTDILIFN